MTAHDCAAKGHVWAEGQRPRQPKVSGKHIDMPVLFTRHRGRKPGKVRVHCLHCKATAELEGAAQFSGPRHGKPVDHTIPPAFKKVLERAMTEDPPAQVPKP